MSDILFTLKSVAKYFGIELASLPKLAKKHVLTDALKTKRSDYRALHSLFKDDLFKDVEKRLTAVAITPAAASVGCVVGCAKDATSKLALYLTICALGISDHPESVRKTILGNADKWTRKDAFKEYPSDLQYVEVLSADPIKTHLVKTYDAILQQLRNQERAAAAEVASKAS